MESRITRLVLDKLKSKLSFKTEGKTQVKSKVKAQGPKPYTVSINPEPETLKPWQTKICARVTKRGTVKDLLAAGEPSMFRVSGLGSRV